MDFTVTRHSFFDSDHGTLRFNERSHPKTDHHHLEFECNCTKNAIERPAGVPHEIQLSIEALAKVDGRDFRFHNWQEETLGFHFQWGEPVVNPKKPWLDRRPHADFWYHQNKAKLQIQVTKENYGLTDCALFNIYFGNKVDTSSFINGHAPSKIVDLTKITPSQVWAHQGMRHWNCRNSEGFEILRETSETDSWRKFVSNAKLMLTMLNPYERDPRTVGIICQELDDNKNLQQILEWQVTFLTDILNRFPATELFRACDKCEHDG